MLSILVIAAFAGAMPIIGEPAPDPQHTPETSGALSKRVAAATIHLVERSVCESDADGFITAASDCPQHVHSILRASVALFCLFAFLVLLHVWQAAKYHRIQAVFGPYIADDTGDMNAKTSSYILLDEPDSP